MGRFELTEQCSLLVRQRPYLLSTWLTPPPPTPFCCLEQLALLTEGERQRASSELTYKQGLVATRREHETGRVTAQRDATWKPGDVGKSAYKTIDQRLKEQADTLSAHMY